METGGPEVIGVSQDEKTHALLSWALMFVISFVSPLIFLLMDKDKPFVYRHAAMGLSLVIALIPVYIVIFILAIILAMAGPLALLVLPLYLAVGVGVLYIVIMGIIKANNGLPWDPPVITQVCKAIFKV